MSGSTRFWGMNGGTEVSYLPQLHGGLGSPTTHCPQLHTFLEASGCRTCRNSFCPSVQSTQGPPPSRATSLFTSCEN